MTALFFMHYAPDHAVRIILRKLFRHGCHTKNLPYKFGKGIRRLGDASSLKYQFICGISCVDKKSNYCLVCISPTKRKEGKQHEDEMCLFEREIY